MSSSPTPDASWESIALRLDADRITDTLATLRQRILERFPESGLGQVCETLLDIGERTKKRLAWVEKPILLLRTATWLMATMVVVGAIVLVYGLFASFPEGVGPAELVQTIEAGIQDVVFVVLGLFFLITAENRIKRRRALGFIKELRAVAHIVDMHQLTKDPDSLLEGRVDTVSSPSRAYTRLEIGRYLDYCSEMLSLTAKIAALYAERFDDAVVLQAVDEVETLATNLSGKIWQKIMMLDAPELFARPGHEGRAE